MDTRREFLKKAILLSGAAGLSGAVPASIQRALAIDPAAGSTYLDAEHIVILMQENRSFDHSFGTLKGVRGFSDPRAAILPGGRPVWLQTNDKGETYAPFRLDIKDSKVTWMGDLPHSRPSQVDAHNGGRHDRWLPAKRSGNHQYADMPLTMGYYTRQDLPFNYALADAFTICDQNFSSAMTSTTPNRSFFWTGNIMSEEGGLAKANIRNDDYKFAGQQWHSFPELLQDNNVSWKFYQNEISCTGGFKGDEASWLSNFGCNLLEFFAAYNVKFAPRYIQSLQHRADTLPAEIAALQAQSATEQVRAAINDKQRMLETTQAELLKWNTQRFEQLSDRDRQLFVNAFTINSGDPSYREVTPVSYNDGTVQREVVVPAGDIFHQFREDVNNGRLPTVSWLASPENFSDHPTAPWYGAWYVSEVMDILTRNPEVWKKTIFILTYDENDGYFDHVVPFSISDDKRPGTGKCSKGIDTEVEHVRLENELKQGIPASQAREAPIGLGFRVPMIIASPWTRGGKVCSQVFDHTSTLQFLENFLGHKLGKPVRTEMISQWRRTICGDLSAVFNAYDNTRLRPLPFLEREPFVENIYNAQFKALPSGYKKWSEEELARVVTLPPRDVLNVQEPGTKPSCALPYELYADGQMDTRSGNFVLRMTCGRDLFGDTSKGAPFRVFAPGTYSDDTGNRQEFRNWSFAVSAGDHIEYPWPLESFSDGRYHLRLYGPNGFYREFGGDRNDPVVVAAAYELNRKTGRPTGNLQLTITNQGTSPCQVTITDHAYKAADRNRQLPAKGTATVLLDLHTSSGWYDFSVLTAGFDRFEKRYAGRVETGRESITDPFMGRTV